MINHVTELVEITQYDDKIASTIAYLVETLWQISYPCPMIITHDQRSEFIGQIYKNSLIHK